MRAPTGDDAAFVAALTSATAPEPWDAARILHEWESPSFDLAADARIDGDGFAAVFYEGAGLAWLDLQGEPDEQLVAWAEERSREHGAERALAGCWQGADAIARALETRGFRPSRHAYRMRISLADEPPAPVWPDGVAVRTFRAGDERTFYDVHQETFADTWEYTPATYEEWTHWLIDAPAYAPDLWFLAEAAGEPAGIAICHAHPSVDGLGWVQILGVRRPWRRHGLGRALLLHAFGEFRRRGFPDAGLGVDAESLTGAHRLYESAGMHVAARFDFYEKRV